MIYVIGKDQEEFQAWGDQHEPANEAEEDATFIQIGNADSMNQMRDITLAPDDKIVKLEGWQSHPDWYAFDLHLNALEKLRRASTQ
jgi:hypothetical protein